MDNANKLLHGLRNVPPGSFFLMHGAPGTGKSAFCRQVVRNHLEAGHSVILVTTERPLENAIAAIDYPDTEIKRLFTVDAFSSTVGLAPANRANSVSADAINPGSIISALNRFRSGISNTSVLITFDSLSVPYLFDQLNSMGPLVDLLKGFRDAGDAIFAVIDDVLLDDADDASLKGAADCVISVASEPEALVIIATSHPEFGSFSLKLPPTTAPPFRVATQGRNLLKDMWLRSLGRKDKPFLRPDVGDKVNLRWLNLVAWSAVIWDSRTVPLIVYETERTAYSSIGDALSQAPWLTRLSLNLIPHRFSHVRDVKWLAQRFGKTLEDSGIGVLMYNEKESKMDEHRFRIYGNASCWQLFDIRARTGLYNPGGLAGLFEALEKNQRPWQAVETKCLGLGDSFCEVTLTPENQPPSPGPLTVKLVNDIQETLVDQLAVIVDDPDGLKPRPRLGDDVSFSQLLIVSCIPALLSEKYRRALQLGGARSGKMVAELLRDGGLEADSAVESLVDLLNYCKIGKVSYQHTLKIEQNCENLGIVTGEHNCHFTTAFLNGFLLAATGKGVKTLRCTGAGDEVCEWEIVPSSAGRT